MYIKPILYFYSFDLETLTIVSTGAILPVAVEVVAFGRAFGFVVTVVTALPKYQSI